ncbi:hypothetical protein Mal64_27840 [Pseudobythopirellula maris]|uniref:DUF2892 domain-containing protein n=1 Tax=Pseudobythopirellula maris TaxID=2527991 RepID=A0A5C5ZJ22_9BACT|nr:hypothetical protein [Pseudobythopirellula maris]TWT87246.1 hypothetical protein Mal64_27840 [Pseudobythopirellula maris]
MNIPSTSQRVPLHTSEAVNSEIRRGIEKQIARHIGASREEIDEHLHKLDQEWDIERTLEANAATLALTGSVLAVMKDRRWAILSMGVTGFLLQHAVQGWCPPLPVLRRLGFRTMREIETERQALKVLRGDYQDVLTEGRSNTREILQAVG